MRSKGVYHTIYNKILIQYIDLNSRGKRLILSQHGGED